LKVNEVEKMRLKNIVMEKKDSVATIVISRPEVLNALDKETILELQKAVEDVRDDENVKVVVITGVGRAFIAGADVAWMRDRSPLEMREFLQLVQSVFNGIENLEKPVIAAINGYALGGGCELAMACDIRIASEDARFGQLEINLGIMPGGGGTQRLPRLVGVGRAKELILTGDMIDAKEAERVGLVNKVVLPDKLESATKELASKLAMKGQVAIKFIKDAINKGLKTNIKMGMAYEAELCSMLFTTEDQKEGMTAFLEKRKPVFKGK